VGSYWREACNITDQTETMVMDQSYSEEGGESIAKEALDGIHRDLDGEETWTRTVSEERGKCCKMWSAVKAMADTSDRWRCFTSVLCL
jgi:hypothetical protein